MSEAKDESYRPPLRKRSPRDGHGSSSESDNPGGDDDESSDDDRDLFRRTYIETSGIAGGVVGTAAGHGEQGGVGGVEVEMVDLSEDEDEDEEDQENDECI